MTRLALCCIAVLAACDPGAQDVDTEDGPGDGYGDERAVRISSPAEGATVDPEFQVRFTAGADVDLVRALVDDEAATGFLDAAGLRGVDVRADPGRHTVALVGYTTGREELSRDEVRVHVVDDAVEGWVSIVTPTDGSSPVEPVVVVVDGSASVALVRLYSDGHFLGELEPEGVFTADFATTGTPRALEARGYASDDTLLSTDTVDITPEAGADPGQSAFSDLIVDLAATYPTDGTYSYYWPSSGSWSGSTRDIWYRGTRVADDGGYSACYCSGITWELYLRAWGEWDRAHGGDADDLNGLSASAVMDMRRDWYVRELDGPGPDIALEGHGLGVPVPSFAHWEPGDLVQLWRTSGSGHTAVFAGWVLDDGDHIVGMDYASCQGTTDGWGYHTEYFGTHHGALDPLKMYAGRALMPADWF